MVAVVSTWLIGVNAAIVYRFWPEKWLTLKIAATSGLLAYCALSALYGTPAQWRLLLGLCAICVDAGAIAGMWDALRIARAGDGVLIAYRRR
jgi:hypothetical protein